MSPEQARGKPLDRRTDIWSFGCVLYEMLTGTRAFAGDDTTDVLAAVLRAEPGWGRLSSTTPWLVGRLLRRCLDKDRRRRLADAGGVRLDLEDALTAIPSGAGETKGRQSAVARRYQFIIVTAALATGILIATLASSLRPSATVSHASRRFPVLLSTTGPTALFYSPIDHNVAISPDGKRIAYVGLNRSLIVRDLDRLQPTEWIAFFVAGVNEIRKVPVAGGPATTICSVDTTPIGGTWTADGRIIFSSQNQSGLMMVPSSGGQPIEILKPSVVDERFRWPRSLPDRPAVLFTLARGQLLLETQVAALDLVTGKYSVVIESGADAQYLSNGYLVYARSNELYTVRFDAATLKVTGTPTPVSERPQMGNSGIAAVSVARDGMMVYLPSFGTGTLNRNLAWVDRKGVEETIPIEPKPYSVPRVSPDGSRIAVQLDDAATPNIFVHDLRGAAPMRLTFHKTPDVRPLWSPDGQWIYFRSDEQGRGIYRKGSDGSGGVERLADLTGDGSVTGFLADGKTLLFNTFAEPTARDVWAFDLDSRKSRRLIAEQGGQGNAALSPNGRWLAYHDDVEGYVFVTPFPDVSGARWQVSPPNSKWPLWSHDGRELFFVSGEPRTLMSVAVDSTGSTFKWGVPEMLFPAPYSGFDGGVGPRNYDLSPDGRRFLTLKDGRANSEATQLVVIENWFEELKQRVPKGN